MTWLIFFAVLILTFLASRSAYVSGILTRALLAVSFGWMALYFYSCWPNPPYSIAGFIGPPIVLWVAIILLRWIFAPPRPPVLSWSQPPDRQHRVGDWPPQ
jgi:hypothetical protein